MENYKTLLGFSDNQLLLIDTRESKLNNLDESKNYKSDVKFTSIVATSFGGIAVGSEKGDIRLFNKVGKIAKTLMKGFGDEIIGIDVTNDGRWVLATTKCYLLLVLTTVSDEKTGFEETKGKEGVRPVMLRIMPNDIKKYKLEPINFDAARFSVSKKREETSFVASTGNHLIIWNFSKVKKGILDSYVIVRSNEEVKQSQFKMNKQEVVVMFERNIGINK